MDNLEQNKQRLVKAIDRAARLGWLQPHPTYGWTMCGAAVEKTILMALDGSEDSSPEPVLTTEELKDLIMSAMWNREEERERRKHWLDLRNLRKATRARRH